MAKVTKKVTKNLNNKINNKLIDNGNKVDNRVNNAVAKELLKQISSNSKNKSKSSVNKDSLKEIESIKAYYYLNEDNINVQIVIHKVMETLEIYLKTVQQILQPEEFHALYECNAFDDDEKGDLFTMYKKIIMMHRELLKSLIQNDEKNSIATVKKVHNESLELKSKMIHIVDKLQKSWKAEPEKRKSVHYFG